MAYVDIVTALAVLQFIVFGFRVGAARGRYGVKAPAITGNEIFERLFRVQQNTLEQLIAFLPGIYLYAYTYVKDPAKRDVGYGMTFLPMVILVVGGLIGAIRALFF
jgi:glutathione S-transferase